MKERVDMNHIGFVGASGLMGHGMAKNLLANGFAVSLTVHDNHKGVADLLAAGATHAGTLADLGKCDAVILCVTGSPQVEGALLGRGGVLSGAQPGLVVIDTSTSEPDSSKRLASVCAEQGVIFVDAPLTRTPVQAELGMLNTMVGAAPEVFAQIRPVLAAFCENIFHVGGPGAGHVIKLLNNFVAQAIATATAEAFAVGAKSNVDLQQLVNVVSAGAANSGIFQMMSKTLEGDFTGLKFELDNARKDLRYYTHLAEGLNAPSILGEAVHQSLVMASALGYGKEFVPALVRAQEKITGACIAPVPTTAA
jgi:3-hydroxyisobutyrate dehydrogenase-like beta-hydroxyacid dehydrogenase